MTDIWFTEIFDTAGKSTGLKSNLPDLACALELVYEVRRNRPSDVVRVEPPGSASPVDVQTLLSAGAEIVPGPALR